ncbi:uncharacterized protein L969DRAFT_95201 [Mixia osmundae IAM 14324]|uniref:YMC020W-like alpha/beta hydrolase domain-containing protein n=1 Tax=Mixia osmundae (strain CBS 9802 / IAM 14324 / JCM 22182 / KY 12970) TaxID=764103 RepID=G7E6V7_MIXOS|nr:uncharacterized protein L969DRAFT_95201 [Mixia osmundae IAM 14324]KEI39051.1 hypothetical protein L969DRAFT_95201 [Mixia osmundae IAM 14324]GAA98567.1 hypothetical protein E5Q_05254 [Mixia osmundae IAM 14324]
MAAPTAPDQPTRGRALSSASTATTFLSATSRSRRRDGTLARGWAPRPSLPTLPSSQDVLVPAEAAPASTLSLRPLQSTLERHIGPVLLPPSAERSRRESSASKRSGDIDRLGESIVQDISAPEPSEPLNMAPTRPSDDAIASSPAKRHKTLDIPALDEQPIASPSQTAGWLSGWYGSQAPQTIATQPTASTSSRDIPPSLAAVFEPPAEPLSSSVSEPAPVPPEVDTKGKGKQKEQPAPLSTRPPASTGWLAYLGYSPLPEQPPSEEVKEQVPVVKRKASRVVMPITGSPNKASNSLRGRSRERETLGSSSSGGKRLEVLRQTSPSGSTRSMPALSSSVIVGDPVPPAALVGPSSASLRSVEVLSDPPTAPIQAVTHPTKEAQLVLESTSMPRSTSWFSWSSPALPPAQSALPLPPQSEILEEAAVVADPTDLPLQVKTPKPAPGWLASWYGTEASPPAPADAMPPMKPTQVAAHVVPEPAQQTQGLGISTSSDAPPVTSSAAHSRQATATDRLATLPASRSAWSLFFAAKAVEEQRRITTDEMEVMEVPDLDDRGQPIRPLQDVKSSKPAQDLKSSKPAPDAEPPKKHPDAPLTSSIRVQKKAEIKPDSPKLTSPPPPNLVLPSFSDTFGRAPRSFPIKQSKLDKALGLVNSYFFSSPASPALAADAASHAARQKLKVKHRDLIHTSEKYPKLYEVTGAQARHGAKHVKKVVVIGIHGWFPSPWLNSVIGKPTGTSEKFATMMKQSIEAYFEEHEPTVPEINVIALSKEGKVSDRVDRHYEDLLSNQRYVDQLHNADAIFIASHSQGTIVATQLLARLIEQKRIKADRVTLLCMCSIALGPFVSLNTSYIAPYLQYFESAAATELFDYQDPESPPSRRYHAAITIILEMGVKVVFIASLNDQVVPLYSGTFASLVHPAILRAMYIDGQAFQSSDFMTNLTVFLLRLRNAGLPDHGLSQHLSEALAGSLTGVGHSSIYEERDVYSLATRYHFETTPVLVQGRAGGHVPDQPIIEPFHPRNSASLRNPYFLPFALRGILDDERVQTLFGAELHSLRQGYEDWRPVSKPLRAVRQQLEPLRLMPKIGGNANVAPKDGQRPSQTISKTAKL